MVTFSTTTGHNTTRLEDIKILGLNFLKFKPLQKWKKRIFLERNI